MTIRKRKDAEQLALDFVEFRPEELRRRNYEASLRHNLEYYPRSENEDRYVPKEVRMARHVNHLECESCKLGPTDHTEDWKWPQPVCIKDVCALEKKLGHPLEGAWVGCLVPEPRERR